jgi:hypothetical protein
LGHDASSLRNQIPTFRRNVLASLLKGKYVQAAGSKCLRYVSIGLSPEKISHSERSEHIIHVTGNDYDDRDGNCGFDGIRGADVYGGGENGFCPAMSEALTAIPVNVDAVSTNKLSQISHKNRIFNLIVLLIVHHSISVK